MHIDQVTRLKFGANFDEQMLGKEVVVVRKE